MNEHEAFFFLFQSNKSHAAHSYILRLYEFVPCLLKNLQLELLRMGLIDIVKDFIKAYFHKEKKYYFRIKCENENGTENVK